MTQLHQSTSGSVWITKKKRCFAAGVALLCLLMAGLYPAGPACAERLTQNNYEEGFPQIKGSLLVWQGYVDGDWEIFVYDIEKGTAPEQITNNSYDDISPQTDGLYVVWLSYSQAGGEIMLYREETGLQQLTNDTRVDAPPRIANGRVVWTASEVTDSVLPGEVFLYNTANGQTQQLTSDAYEDRSARINDSVAAWVRTDQQINHVVLYDLNTGTTDVDPPGFAWEDSAQRDGDLEVLSRHDGSDTEIVIRNLQLDTCDPLTRNTIEDRSPCISGDYVAWVGGEGGEAEIYLSGDEVLPLPVLDKVAGDKTPGGIIRIIGRNFGGTQNDGVVHIGSKAFGPGNSRIKYWSDTRIRVKLPAYKCEWFKGAEFRRQKVWVTVGEEDSGAKRIRVLRPSTCP